MSAACGLFKSQDGNEKGIFLLLFLEYIGGKELREIPYCCSVRKWRERHGSRI